MIRKVLIMNRIENGKKQICGLLSLEQNENLKGRLRVYNLGSCSNLKLSLKIGENMLLFDNIKSLENFLFNTIYHDISLPIYAVLFSDEKGQINVVASGHSEGDDKTPNDLFDDYTNDKTLNEIRQMIDAQIGEQDAGGSNLKVESEFGEQKGVTASSFAEREKIENEENCTEKNEKSNEQKERFFDLIKPQIDELFSTFPHNKQLEQKIENSSWVDISNGGESYVLGQIFDDGEVHFICYGIPAENINVEPPKHLNKFCQWLPLSIYKPEGNGFWLMYQDAKTGENVVIDGNWCL